MSLDLSTRILPAPSGSVLGHEFRDHCQCEEPPERRAPVSVGICGRKKTALGVLRWRFRGCAEETCAKRNRAEETGKQGGTRWAYPQIQARRFRLVFF